ncbi:hypothetical protein [Haloarcula sp. CGMCC 1.6347]|uniref:hypothetical protein n=1 Tax=Haloarcula sp. CGMCC 1.6347 TaxID=3111455 RepID=UPI00300EE0F5
MAKDFPAEDLPPVLTFSYKRFDEETTAAVESGHELRDYKPIDAHEIEVERDAAQQAYQDIRAAIDERSQYWVIDEIVVGVETHLKAGIYTRCAFGDPVEAVYGVDITVVPGDMIAPVIPAKKRLEEHLEDNDA